jgi:Asp-tRNA(Asn)/Glu-tRNA(Gln) amidotransferase A subunit family amidase
VGLQLVGRPRAEWDLLAVARAFEAATGHAAVMPASAPALTSAPPAGP